MKISELHYEFPEDLIATSPVYPPRVLAVSVKDGMPKEISWTELLEIFAPGDLLIMNNTKVIPRRIFSGESEILFINEIAPRNWEVLFPSRGMKIGEELPLPGGLTGILREKGRPQILEVSGTLTSDYFFQHGEIPLPPYIQKARSLRHQRPQDLSWYQTVYARLEGSLAAPTAGLHFKSSDLEHLKKKGVHLAEVTLHVGLGTFLPIQTDDVEAHPIHEESFEISAELIRQITSVKSSGHKVYALGTTTARVLETLGRLQRGEDADRMQIDQTPERGISGKTRIYLYPGKEFFVVDGLLTNFHQPGSSLIAMVSAFAGTEKVREVYQYAIQNRFRLFSYGDLSVWLK